MPRARNTVATVSASDAERSARTRRKKGAKRKREEKDGKDTGMGTAVLSQEEDPPKNENPTSLQTTINNRSTQTLPLPEKRDYSRMCSKCSSFLKPAVVPAGRTTSLLCTQCSTTRLCEHCLFPCPDGTCTNQSCHVVSSLLTCDRVTDLASNVYGCPLLRACPRCHNIMMHMSGCKYVKCAQCSHRYCFICLMNKEVCVKAKTKYWSLTCSAPTAARQRFQT